MEPSQKKSFGVAVLFNALVYPGSGHMYLGKKLRGAWWMVLSTVLLAWLMWVWMHNMVLTTMDLANSLQKSSLIEQSFTIFQATWSHVKNQMINLLTALLIAWLFAIADLWWMKKTIR